jgi:hypothetical protein
MTRTFAGYNQSLNPLAKRRIAATDLVEVGCALFAWQFHRRIKEGGFPLVGLAHGDTVSYHIKRDSERKRASLASRGYHSPTLRADRRGGG